jgi:hypothetical protein
MRAEIPKVFALQKDLFVANDVFCFQTGQNPHLIEGVLDFFLGQIG